MQSLKLLSYRSPAAKQVARASLSRHASSQSSVPVPPVHASNSSAEAKESSQTEVVPQAPNYAAKWSASQAVRPGPASSPRFEQVAYEFQPAPQGAMEMVNSHPIILSDARTAVCDGGGGPLGHPKIFINLDKPGPRPCGYCGLRFERSHTHHH